MFTPTDGSFRVDDTVRGNISNDVGDVKVFWVCFLALGHASSMNQPIFNIQPYSEISIDGY